MHKQAWSKRLSSDPVRVRLFRDLLALILITVGVLVTASALLINDIKRDFANARLQDASALVRDEVRGLLLPVAQQLLILRDGLRNRDLTPSSAQALNEQLMPALAHMTQIAAAVFADSTGREYFLRPSEDRWMTHERVPPPPAAGADDAQAVVSEWRNDDDRISSQAAPSRDDPRQQPWFQAAALKLQADQDPAADDPDPRPGAPQSSSVTTATSDHRSGSSAEPRTLADPSGSQPALTAQVTWSLPYHFVTLDQPGITVATAWRQDAELFVLALDVTLAQILATINRLQADSAGKAFLFDRDGGVYQTSAEGQPVAASSDPGAGVPGLGAGAGLAASGFYNAEQRLGGATVFEAIAAWRSAGEPQDEPIRFESGGRDWWAGFVPLEPVKRNAWVGVAYPSSGPLGLLRQRWPLFAGTALVILALGIGLTLVVVRRYSQRLRELPKLSIDASQPEIELYDLIGRGESAHLEFKSTMRLNLRSGKNDKAIELAWLKGVAAFLNSEGGILLLGVADDGEVLGLGGDGFANDDKCLLHFKNLVNQHLGAEAMRHLRFRLFQLEDKQIGAIECEPADRPVYLRPGNGESFLIRTGPSNSELPISRALGYIEIRF